MKYSLRNLHIALGVVCVGTSIVVNSLAILLKTELMMFTAIFILDIFILGQQVAKHYIWKLELITV